MLLKFENGICSAQTSENTEHVLTKLPAHCSGQWRSNKADVLTDDLFFFSFSLFEKEAKEQILSNWIAIWDNYFFSNFVLETIKEIESKIQVD